MSPRQLLGHSHVLGLRDLVPPPSALESRVCSRACFRQGQARAQCDETCPPGPEVCPYLHFSEPSQMSAWSLTVPLSFAELPGKDTKEQKK